MATVIVDRYRSKCGECGGNADPSEPAHFNLSVTGVGCGAIYDAIASAPYLGEAPEDVAAQLHRMRPDLPIVAGGA